MNTGSRFSRSERRGFTLVEIMVAVTITAILIVGVSAATQSAVKTAERQKGDARIEEQRARSIELLRQDWRGRLRVVKPASRPALGIQTIAVSTSADSVAVSNLRSTRLVTYTATDKGLFRKEGDAESRLIDGPATLEFWDGVAWRSDAAGAQFSVRLKLQNPEETVVLR